MRYLAIAGLLAAGLVFAEDQPKSPIASNPVVNVSGRITKVDAFGSGKGMPSLVVDADGKPTTVILGSMRYLMEQNFSPKAGAQIEVKGYKTPEAIVSIEVRLPADNKTLKLRDEDGWPLWRGGGHQNRGRWK